MGEEVQPDFGQWQSPYLLSQMALAGPRLLFPSHSLTTGELCCELWKCSHTVTSAPFQQVGDLLVHCW